MRVLALDTTTASGSVAIVDDSGVLVEAIGDPARSHAERLPGDILRAVDQAGIGIADIDCEGRYLRADFGRVSVISVYLPSGSSGAHRQAIRGGAAACRLHGPCRPPPFGSGAPPRGSRSRR